MSKGTISILGSGWLGLPLAKMLQSLDYSVKLSTTTESKLTQLENQKLNPFLVSIDAINGSTQEFLSSKYLIINIPSKDIEDYKSLISQIETSEITHVIYISSTSVYHTSNEIITDSDKFVDYKNPFYIIENMLRNNLNFKTTIIRFAGLIGPNRNPGNFFKSRKIVTNSNTPVNLIHQDDCIEIIHQIIKQNIWEQTFNACADTHPTKKEFYSHAIKMAKNPLPIFKNSESDTAGKFISNEKLKQTLSYKFIHSDLLTIKF